MQIVKLFDVNKGERTLQVADGVRFSRNTIVKYLKGSAYLWDASTLKHHLNNNPYLKTLYDSSDMLSPLLNAVGHPIFAYNMTCVLENPSVLKGLFKLNAEFSVIAAESVYGNVLVLDIMCLPENMLNDVQPDIHDYSEILKRD